MVPAQGYIKLHRKFFEDDPFWNQPRERSRAEAWIDLIQLAAWRQRNRFHGTERIEVARGELVASRRFLAQRWNWTDKQVRCFIEILVKRGQVRAMGETVLGQRYLVVNYETYQGEGPSNGQAELEKGPSRGQAGAKQGPKEEEVRRREEEGEEENPEGTLFESSCPTPAAPNGVERPKRSKSTEFPPLPELLDTPEFREAWDLRVKERAEKKSKGRLTPSQVGAQFAQLAKVAREHGMAVAVECLRKATAAGWQGVVFEDQLPSANGNKGGAPRIGFVPHPATAAGMAVRRSQMGAGGEDPEEVAERERKRAEMRAFNANLPSWGGPRIEEGS